MRENENKNEKISDDRWNGSLEPLLQFEEEKRYLEYLNYLADQN